MTNALYISMCQTISILRNYVEAGRQADYIKFFSGIDFNSRLNYWNFSDPKKKLSGMIFNTEVSNLMLYYTYFT